MDEYIARITVPKGWNEVKKCDAEKILEKAITTLNPDIKVHFGVFCTGVKWYATEKNLDKK